MGTQVSALTYDSVTRLNNSPQELKCAGWIQCNGVMESNPDSAL